MAKSDASRETEVEDRASERDARKWEFLNELGGLVSNRMILGRVESRSIEKSGMVDVVRWDVDADDEFFSPMLWRVCLRMFVGEGVSRWEK